MTHDRRPPNRTPPTWRQILNPIWHLSDDQRDLSWPVWCPAYLRWFPWFVRNPCCNFLSVVVGIAHRSRTVYCARGDGWTYVEGLNHGWIKADESNLRLPFVSFRGEYVEFMLGWKTSGGLAAFPFRRANSRGPGG